MNKILVPQVTFKNIVSDEKRIERAYIRIFEIAKRNILTKRALTTPMSREYTKVQYGNTVSDNRRSSQETKS